MKCYTRNCKRHPKDIGAYINIFIWIMILMVGLYNISLLDIHLKAQANDIIPPTVQVVEPASPSPLPATKSAELIAEVPDESKEIEEYIKTIFGKDATIAIAVSHVECNPKNKAYPRCVYHTEHEYSVGIFQINLFNKSHWIHAKKVPGVTMDEKIEWLKNPYNNTLIAYKIFKDSGWYPWAGYTSGRYLNNL